VNQLVRATLEPNDQNTVGVAVTLYYTGNPSVEAVKQDLKTNLLVKKLNLSVDTTDPYFSVVFSAAPETPNLVRAQAHPTC
jgi:hypothetical protein